MGHIFGADRSQLLLLPDAVDDYVGPDHPVRFIDAFVDSLDLKEAGFQRVRPNDKGRPDALRAAGADVGHVYHDFASGVSDDRPGLDGCVRALWTGDVLVVWKLDRLGRTLAHLVNTVQGSAALGCIKGPSVASKTEIPV